MVAPLAALAVKGAAGLVGAIAGHVSKASGAASPAGTPPTLAEKARKTADDFETMFLEQMLDRVMDTGSAEGPLGENGTGGGVWRSMLVKEYAGAVAKSGSIGLSDQVYGEILKLQEGSAHVGR